MAYHFFKATKCNEAETLRQTTTTTTTSTTTTTTTINKISNESICTKLNGEKSASNKVQSETCIFPEVDPFEESIMNHVRRHKTVDCSRGIPSIVDAGGDYLRVDPIKVRQKLGTTPINVECRYRKLSRRKGNDFHVEYHAWSESFNSSIRLHDNDIDDVQVDCYSQDGGSGKEARLVARSYIAVVRKKEERDKKRFEEFQEHVKKHSPKEAMNVIVVGIDNTSKQNLIRSMPKTRKFLFNKMNALELNKFNKVGLNTFPNIIPLLTGLHPSEIKNWNMKSQPFDMIDHLFLWNHFRKAGYITATHVDALKVTEFHYFRKGWVNPPFDFYPRPVVLASQPDKSVFGRAGRVCMGDVPEVSWTFDFLLRLATTYKDAETSNPPYFVYTLPSRLSHDNQNLASAGDELYLEFFRKLVDGNLLNNTLLVFFSDHGERFGQIRGTYNGVMEANMPIMFLAFPPWFEAKYPDVMRNVRTNTNRLATPFDVHATLLDVLYFTGKPKLKHRSEDRGISLFEEIPYNRTCQYAGIPFQFCSCKSFSQVRDKSLENILVREFMKKLRSFTENHRDICVPLTHSKTVNIWEITPQVDNVSPGKTMYFLVIRTGPFGVPFEGMVSMVCNSDGAIETRVTELYRIALYQKSTTCTGDIAFKDYCDCYRSNSTLKHDG